MCPFATEAAGRSNFLHTNEMNNLNGNQSTEDLKDCTFVDAIFSTKRLNRVPSKMPEIDFLTAGDGFEM